MSRCLLCALLALTGAHAMTATDLISRAALKLGAVTPDHATVAVGSPVELTVALDGTWDNPFDPADVSLDADVTAPDGRRLAVPGFLDAPVTSRLENGREQVQVAGPPVWKLRLTPTAAGSWQVVAKARDRSGEAAAPAVAVTATAADVPGFIRVSTDSPGYFRTDRGESFFPVGENICWPGGRGTFDMTDWITALGAAKGNWIRVWMSSWHCGLEWATDAKGTNSTGGYSGVGRYNLANAWKMDRILQVAHQAGVKVMLCFGTYGEFTDGGFFNEGQWKANPYNQANGGPCAKPADFWTSAEARKLYQQRLRYIVARWGHSPDVFAWEFWNECPPQAAWTAEMATWLKQHDPNRHLVSTTYGDAATWRAADVDFTMTHHYGDSGNRLDFVPEITGTARAQAVFAKPHIAAEFGIDWRTSDTKYDPAGLGINLHNVMWAGLMAGDGGTPMIWYWDGYVHPKKLYPVFTPIADFVAAVDWAHTRFAPLEGVTVESPAGGPETFTAVDVVPDVDWGRPGSGRASLGRDGKVSGPLPGFLGSPTRDNGNELHSSLTLELDLPAEQTVTFRVGTVCTSAHLQAAVDGATLVDEELKAGEAGKGPWKSSTFIEQYKCWQSVYDKDYTVKVPAGRHTLVLRNTAGDWLTITSLHVPGARSSRTPNVAVTALGSAHLRLAWVHQQQSGWKNALAGEPAPKLDGFRLNLPATDGAWTVTWWDTWHGGALRTDTVTATGGRLVLDVPAVERDVALRATH